MDLLIDGSMDQSMDRKLDHIIAPAYCLTEFRTDQVSSASLITGYSK